MLEKLKNAKSPLEIRKEYKRLPAAIKNKPEIKEILAEKKHIHRNDKYLLFFDTETVGLPKNYNIPYWKDETLENWPRITQIGFIKTDFEGNEITRYKMLVNPGVPIAPEATAATGITDEMVQAEGCATAEMLRDVDKLFVGVGNVVAHNANFDWNVLMSEFKRNKIWCNGGTLRPYCTMNNPEVIGYVGAVQPEGHRMAGKPKWPTLTELHEKLFGEGFDGAHDAMVDIEVTVKCFFELRRLNII